MVTETSLKYPRAVLVSKHGPSMVLLCDYFTKSETIDAKKLKFRTQNSSTQVIKHTKKGQQTHIKTLNKIKSTLNTPPLMCTSHYTVFFSII